MKTLHRFRFVILALMGVGLVAATVWTMRSNDPDRVAGQLGPTPGPNSEGHVKAKRAYLVRLATEEPQREAAGLVSLTKQVSAPSAQAMVPSIDATIVFVRYPGSEPEAIPVKTTIAGAVADGAAELRNKLDAEIKDLETQAASAEGENKQLLTTAIAQRKGSLATAKGDCACVYAFGLEGVTVSDLATLAKRPEVKLVDVPDPLTADLGGWELIPVVPPSTAIPTPGTASPQPA